jgi:ATP-dependent Clp protease ATP-binding subunit ClpX
LAHEEKTGARGLVSVIERALLPFEKRLPSTRIRQLVVTLEVVQDPAGTLERLLANPEDPEFLHRHQAILEQEKQKLRELIGNKRIHYLDNYPLVFTPSRVEVVLDRHVRTDQPLESVFDEVLLLYNQIRVFEDGFFEDHGVRIEFNDEAVNRIIEEALQRGITAVALCNEIASDFDYGFKLINERSGKSQFVLPPKAVAHPQTYMDELIREHYRKSDPHRVETESGATPNSVNGAKSP